jgi:acyl carrier protein
MTDRHTRDFVLKGVSKAIRAGAKGPMPEQIELGQRFINDLGFDSMSIALLALALEDEFDRPILLHDWIARHTDPTSLTVASLCAYLEEVLPDARPSVHL